MHGVAKVRERFPGTLESKGEKKHTLEESSGEVLKLGMVSVLKKEVAALESLTKCPHNTHLTKNISCIGFRSFKSESILMQMLELIFFPAHTMLFPTSIIVLWLVLLEYPSHFSLLIIFISCQESFL